MTDFPVTAATPRIQYVADGVQTVFTVPFPVPVLDDLRVRFGDGTVPTAFTATGLGGASASIAFAAPPPAATRITIRRVMPHARLTDFDEGGELRASALNAELDALVMQVQQVAEAAARALAYAPEAPPAPVPHLPLPAPGYLRWNDAADALVLDPVPQALVAQAQAAATTASSAATTATAAATTATEAAADAASSAAGASAAAGTASSAATTAVDAANDATASAALFPAERMRVDLAALRQTVRAAHGSDLALPAAGLDFITGHGLAALTFSAASGGRTWWDAAGLLRSAAAQAPRHDHDPLTGTPRGLLVEPARTNVLLHSTNPSLSPWAVNGVTRGTGAVAPDGTGTYARIASSGAGGHEIFQPVTVAAGAAYTASAIVRSTASQRWLRLTIYGTALVGSAWFDLANGTWGTVTAGTVAHPPVALGDGRWRIAITATATGSGTGYWDLIAADGDGAAGGWSASGETYDLWAPQLEAGTFPTSYIATAGAQVTRAAELAGMADADDALGARAGTVLLAARPLVAPQGLSRLFHLGGATDGCSLYLPDGADDAVLEVRAGDVTIASIGAPTALAAGATLTLAASWAPDDMALTAAGAAPAHDSAGTPALSPAGLDLGHAGGAQVFAGWFERVLLFPRRLPDAALQALTDL
jgi:hypothetical protein